MAVINFEAALRYRWAQWKEGPVRRRSGAGLIGLILCWAAPAVATAAEGIRSVDPDAATGSSAAVVVGPAALAHTAQILPLDGAGRVVGKGKPAEQVERVWDNLAAVLAEARSGPDRLVKVNAYVARPEFVQVVGQTLARRLRAARPAVSYVVTALPHADALVALDAVAVAEAAGQDGAVRHFHHKGLPGAAAQVAVLPRGPVVYVSGQAEPGDLAQATRKTLASLRDTLAFLGLKPSDVVQVKSFLKPAAGAAVVEREMARFFAGQAVPPQVFVEWVARSPIEIELIAAAPAAKAKADEAVEYLTPPGMKASPVFSRVTRVNAGRQVYVSGLYATGAADADGQINEIFSRLKQLLQKSGSDLRHLAKATYYVTDEMTTGRKLNELRPKYYDPSRPPAASKAQVAGVGREARTITLDMIAVVP